MTRSADQLNGIATRWLSERFVGGVATIGDDSFGSLVGKHFADDAALTHLARIVRGAASPEDFDVMPESAGLRALVEGCLAAQLPDSTTNAVFDALLGKIRDRIQRGEPLESNPFLDRTTGLPNRLLTIDRLTTAVAFAHRHDTMLAVCAIRFDLSEVADHVARVALEIADRLRHTFREIDTIARLGSGEFCVVITDAPKRDHAEIAISKLTEVVAEPFDIGERSYSIAAHIGISLYPAHGHDAQTLLEAARAAAAAAPALSVYGEP